MKMITVYDLKPKFQNLLRPISNMLFGLGVSANMVTLFAMFASILFGLFPFIYNASFYWFLVPVFFFVRMALNAIDGMIAKDFNQISNLGAFLNEIGDIVSDSAVILAFCVISNELIFPLVILCLMASITEATGLCSKGICGIRTYNGPMGKSDRAFVLGACSLFYGFGWLSVDVFQVVLWVMNFLCMITIYNRMGVALKSNG